MKFVRLAAAVLVSAATLLSTAAPVSAGDGMGCVVSEALASTKINIASCKVSAIAAREYTGSAQKPAVVVKYGSVKLTKGADYTVSYKNNTEVGKATVTIKGKGKYTGSKKVTFKIIPKKPVLSAFSDADKVYLSWKTAPGAVSYMVYMAQGSGDFKKVGTVKATSMTIDAKPGTYKFKVRSLTVVNGVNYYGQFSKVKTIKVASKSKAELKTDDFMFNMLRSGTGELHYLSEYAGKPIIVNMWATWCGPCIRELPAFNRMYKKYGDKVQFIMLNLDLSLDETKAYLKSKGYSFAPCIDGNAYSTYGTGYIPLTLMINADGELVYNQTGSMSESTLESYIKNLLLD